MIRHDVAQGRKPDDSCEVVSRDASVEICPATRADMPACAAIFNRWVDETPWMPRVHSAEDVTRHYLETAYRTCRVLMASRPDGRPVAYIAISNDGFVNALYADPAGRGLGIGKALLDFAKQLSPSGLRLWTFVENKRAQRFYVREGFNEVRRTEGDNEEGLSDILFEWRSEVKQ